MLDVAALCAALDVGVAELPTDGAATAHLAKPGVRI